MASAEVKFISKRATRVTRDLAMMSWGRNLSGMKRKATSKDKCYNCQKYGHFGRDCRLPDQQSSKQRSFNHRKKPRPEESTKQQPTRNRAHIAATTDDDKNSKPEPFRPGVANMVKESKMQAPRDVWYLDSCAFCQLTNNKDLFIEELQPKCLDFTTAGGQILQEESIGTIAIPLADGSSLKPRNVAYDQTVIPTSSPSVSFVTAILSMLTTPKP